MNTLLTQLVVAVLVVGAAGLVFRRVAADYAALGRLTLLSTVLETAIFFVHGSASYAFLDSRLETIATNTPAFALAVVALTGGLVVTLVAMSGLGWGVSVGQSFGGLRCTGFYRYSRNPQIVAYFFVVAGYALLWPAWSGLAWVALYVFIAHLMVRTEEDHLRRTFGAEYDAYCRRVPRYFGF